MERSHSLETQIADLRGQLTDAHQRLATLEAQIGAAQMAASIAIPAPAQPGVLASAPVSTSGGRFGALYPAFEDRFRGSEAEIARKQSVYLPVVERVARNGAVVDIGPGRGEWLGLLREHGVRAYGVDTNAAFVAACNARGLRVVLADACDHLDGLPAGSLDMVTAFHVVEHLETEALLALIAAASHALRPGGCLLLETPNPTNLIMGACDFYTDPTHRAPLPPTQLEFFVAAYGFGEIEVRNMHPRTEQLNELLNALNDPALAPLRPLIETVATRFYGPQDYAVLGYRLPGAGDAG